MNTISVVFINSFIYLFLDLWSATWPQSEGCHHLHSPVSRFFFHTNWTEGLQWVWCSPSRMVACNLATIVTRSHAESKGTTQSFIAGRSKQFVSNQSVRLHFYKWGYITHRFIIDIMLTLLSHYKKCVQEIPLKPRWIDYLAEMTPFAGHPLSLFQIFSR